MLRIILTTISISIVLLSYSQKVKENNENGRQNWFPNVGNVGIGTRSPVTDLEIIGSIKASNNIESSTLNVGDLFGTNFIFTQNGSMGGNFNVIGNVGIGVAEALEKLHVIGNIKSSQKLVAEILEVTTGNFSNNISVGGSASVIGNTVVSGLLGVGINNPEEKIHVLGNVKVSQALLADTYTVRSGTVTEDLKVQRNADVDGDLTLGRLEVEGNSDLAGDLNLAGNATIGQNAQFDGNVGIGTVAGSERVNVAGDIKVTQEISSNTTSTFNATVYEDLRVERNTFISSNLSIDGNSSIQGETSSGTLLINTNSKIQGNEVIDGNLSIGTSSATERVNVSGNVKVDGDLMAEGMDLESLTTNELETNSAQINNDANISGNLDVDGNVGIGVETAQEKFHMVGNARIEGNVSAVDATLTNTITNEATINNNASIGGNLGVTGNVGIGVATAAEKLQVGGNVKVDGDLMAEGMNVKDFSATSIETNTAKVNQDADISGNLGVYGNVGIGVETAQEKLHMVGNARIEGNVSAVDATLTTTTTNEATINNNASIGGNLGVTGNVGIGVATATEKLQVGGNVKVDGDLMAESMNVEDFSATSIETNTAKVNQDADISGNLGVGGNIGIGVETAEEKLHVGGNIKSDGDLSAVNVTATNVSSAQLETGELKITQNANIVGNIGVGVASAQEKVHVGGNVKVDGGLSSNSLQTGSATFSQNAEVSGNLGVGGNVGIGVPLATEKLHVGGNLKVTGDLMADRVNVDGFSTTTFETNEAIINHDANIAGNLGVSGNVGIGVVAPEQKLHVGGSLKVDDGITSATFTGTSLSATSGTIDDLTSVSGTFSSLSSSELINHQAGESLVLGTKGLDRVTILSNGKVGIGTEDPDNLLTVAGNIHGQRVKVTIEAGTGPDYVFDQNYDLKSLEETSLFIMKNKHLPEVPTAKKMEEDGIELGEMNMLLLKKIEELTLYQIELLDRIKKLEKSLEKK